MVVGGGSSKFIRPLLLQALLGLTPSGTVGVIQEKRSDDSGQILKAANVSGKQQARHQYGCLTAAFFNSSGVKFYADRYARAGGRMSFYLRELRNLCQTLSRHSPGVPLSVVTDSPLEVRSELEGCSAFEQVIENQIQLKPNTSWAEKPVALMQSPYLATMFLDADIMVCAPLDSMFRLLRHYDMALVQEPLNLKDMQKQAHEIKFDRYFEMNSGMVLYRRRHHVHAFFLEMQRRQTKGDQHYFHLYGTAEGLLGRSMLRVLQLPPEYNLRMRVRDAPRLLTNTVRLIHGKSRDFPHMTCENINQHTGFRLWSSKGGTVFVPPQQNQTS